MLSIKWYQFVWNDDVRRLTKQPKLTAIIQSRRLTLFGHIMRMDNNADAKRILLAPPPADWRRQPGCTRVVWLSTIQQDLRHHHLMLLKQQLWLRTSVAVMKHCFLSTSLYVTKRGAYWDRLCRDVVGRWLVGWLSRACTVAKRCILGL